MRPVITTWLIVFGCMLAAIPANGQQFDATHFAHALDSLLERGQQPNARQGKIAMDFANYCNRERKTYPDSEEQIDLIIRTAAISNGLNYEQSNGIITTAAFQRPAPRIAEATDAVNPPATPEPEIKPEEVTAEKDGTAHLGERMPRFPGCEQEDSTARPQCAQVLMLKYVYSNLRYPAAARKAGIEGQVVVTFTVTKLGEITDVRCKHGLGYGTDEEAIRIVESMNALEEKWIPGLQQYEPVDATFTLPISFKLQ